MKPLQKVGDNIDKEMPSLVFTFEFTREHKMMLDSQKVLEDFLWSLDTYSLFHYEQGFSKAETAVTAFDNAINALNSLRQAAPQGAAFKEWNDFHKHSNEYNIWRASARRIMVNLPRFFLILQDPVGKMGEISFLYEEMKHDMATLRAGRLSIKDDGGNFFKLGLVTGKTLYYNSLGGRYWISEDILRSQSMHKGKAIILTACENFVIMYEKNHKTYLACDEKSLSAEPDGFYSFEISTSDLPVFQGERKNEYYFIINHSMANKGVPKLILSPDRFGQPYYTRNLEQYEEILMSLKVSLEKEPGYAGLVISVVSSGARKDITLGNYLEEYKLITR